MADLMHNGANGVPLMQPQPIAALPRPAHLNADGRTPLHYACAGASLEMVTRIVSRGGDLSAGPESPLLAAIDQARSALLASVADG